MIHINISDAGSAAALLKQILSPQPQTDPSVWRQQPLFEYTNLHYNSIVCTW